ncbi:D-alanyl-D-alanine carboxypeptidase family protein [Paenibacillus aurantius]|uniref:D-alanyl-D-alanine carboxypeptidase family protein n=1 Tax=Paenibacillus aurantius TaxID=2918900 RepID=A0AA96RFT0_9BACL|nr:D-alanyl-D-alanine carboxypeptidase family protein [Paenibacillus aurantius]WJH34236.1 D-alanyl-D-alanine carboxypeptidase [Paenibacillus sp. CC-CFT747]WNQ09329.1 D-alanyl-D-alanine carboxypeptidase family protein [Paenibacillus aurantius]
MKRMLITACAIVLGLTAWSTGSSRVLAVEPITTHAQGAALIDVTSGRILYSQQGDRPMRIASLTKIMTAIVAIEKGDISDMVTVGPNAYRKEGSSIYLNLGEKISLEHLLYGLMLRSGNDAATAIAEHVGGSVEGFATLMNAKAEEIGMDHSHFMNPSGLDHNEHYASANDMAKLTAYALKNPKFREIVKTPTKKVPRENQPWDSVWNNKNKMLKIYDGADGVKTGYTKLALRCLVSSATRGTQQLAVVTLNDSDDWADHSRLLDYGFHNYPLQTLVVKGAEVDGKGRTAYSFEYPLAEEEKASVRKVTVWEPARSLNAKLGSPGQVQVYLGERKIGAVPLSASQPAAGGVLQQAGVEGDPASPDPGFGQVLRRVWKTLFEL